MCPPVGASVLLASTGCADTTFKVIHIRSLSSQLGERLIPWRLVGVNTP
jgi:hypothetical protein